MGWVIVGRHKSVWRLPSSRYHEAPIALRMNLIWIACRRWTWGGVRLCEYDAFVSHNWTDTSCVQSHLVTKGELTTHVEKGIEVAHDKVGTIANHFHVCFE